MNTTNSFFEVFYSENYNKAIRFARSMVFDPEVAQEIVHNAFVHSWSFCGENNHHTLSATTLILTIRERSIEYLDGKKVAHQIGLVSDLIRDANDIPSYLSHDLIKYVNLLMNTLHSRTHDCFTKVRLEGKKYQDVANEMSLSPAFVESELQRTSWEMHMLLRTYKEVEAWKI